MESFALWTSAEAARATQGSSDGFWTASGISIDSRSIAFGDLFIALRGPNFDGHVFVADALAKGAAAAMVDRVPETLPPGANLLQVKDTFEGLNALAAAARQRCGAKVVAVTGSVGKTSTKEMLRHVFAEQAATHATTGNLNNHWGVPLTLARMPVDSRYAVIEMGMNHAGEIAPLSTLARPHVAVITAIEAVHLENFTGIEGIADAKAEIFAGLEPGGIAVINRDTPHFERAAAAARAAGASEVIGFGESREAQARLVKYAPHAACSCVAADILGHPMTFKIGAPGRHWVLNALGVLAAAQAAGADLAEAGMALAGVTAPKGRGERHVLHWRDGGEIEVIDDSYNASPTSMRAAFAVLAMAKPGSRGRRIAVLGDMLELGPDAEAAHAGLAADLERDGIDLVFAAGPLMRALYEALPVSRRGHHAANSTELLAPLRRAIRSGDVLLVKGSHGSRMDKVIDDLLTPAPAPRAANGW
ncbi:MAG TPA: UDP-N-acetylmuramoylalanyl-D-glutamyl-2,6-diaminopimelate--D-alanyl-D-alanine ligase [Ferrovibrio sp.]|uniref:UDP-N-acetylmuramoylalanyl-D-glutamyl-2, 6-diaminopimelate--D-alanyl-D-alanine ligase n=1 Tax=Ferrovibrio sp. TaxID=1917215 RepID=UPI002B4B6539|nr:UDP-N-acetylmuramoylalanyl-D-glutamyl-2,6-diaminopimelate--D-alanyl-D-alanine ligase [Ferrovibrio sp.]HLT78461.1 UDP-N-acetylmuramoylalanyl-D-glutamyl-2,6-diaminopimelate--D-alanyl-D-alanine ligase [Ferrovibrio sp.]